MAELAISAAMLVSEAVPPLLKALNLSEEVWNDVRSMKSWLQFMKAFMEEECSYYGREGRSGRMHADQLENARNIAYEIEDVMDEFLLHTPQYTFHDHGVTRKAHNFAHQVRHGFPLCGISKKMATIKRDIDDFKSQNELDKYSNNPRPSCSSNTRNGLRACPLLLDGEMVGYEEPKGKLIARLEDREKKLLRLAVDGPAGSGKTTLVKNVYWNRGICRQFDCHAWVFVSRHFDLEDIFISMLKQFCSSRKEPYPGDDGSNTITKIRNYLDGKRYIVVLDDVCKKEDWEKIKDAFPDASRGSRIMITTSSSEVASACAYQNDHIISLINGLEWLQGWTLFCRNAFPNGECPSELEDCSVRIVKRCEGLPLAINAIGKALAQKSLRTLNEWEKFHDSLLGSEIKEDPNIFVITNALLPGYMDLSSNLKSCLLYFSIFPEDHSVSRGKLVRLWVAEGFAFGTNNQTPEEVAEGYLNELINRHFVHVSNWDFDNRPRSCRVSSLVLNFIIQKCKDENFASIFPRENTSLHKRIRRLSVFTHFPKNTDYGGVRSMFLSVHGDPNNIVQSTYCGGFHYRLSSRFSAPATDFEKNLPLLKLLKVLDIQWDPLTHFPQDIARLSMLKYLNLRGTTISMIPGSIGKLSHLETLDLKQTDVTQLPKEISHLHNLRNILAYKYDVKNFVFFDSVRGVGISSGISKLKNLQKLSLVKVDRKGQILKDLRGMTQLRKLGLTGLDREHGQEFYEAVSQMKNLITLDLCSATKEKYLPFDEMSYLPNDTLQRLYLKGRLETFPCSISSLNNLCKIGLKWSKMERSPLMVLQDLPNLLELQLVDCYVGEELIFEASCFKKLKIVLIEEFPQLHTIVIGEGAMPELKEISLRKCPNLPMCPLGIENLKVQELTLFNMSEELIARLRKNGEDRAMVEDIHVVHSFILNGESWVKENLSDSFTQ